MAPTLEDMGLHGLCDALGIPRPRKNTKPAPAPKKTTPVKKSRLENVLNAALFVIFALMILLAYLSVKG